MRDRIQMLLIDSDREQVEILRTAFDAVEAHDFEIVNVERLNDALPLLDSADFDLIVVDLELPDAMGLEAFTLTHGRAPDLPIIIYTRIDDELMALNTAQEGAQDYIVKGQTAGPQLVRRIRYAIERHNVLAQQVKAAKGQDSGRVIGFMGAKGGVGTTTVALNVAAALAGFGHVVNMVELRADFGTLALQLNRTPQSNLSDLLSLPADRIDRTELQKHLLDLQFGLKVLFGPQHVGEFNEVEPEAADNIIRAMSAISEFTILDLPCDVSAATQLAARMCDYVCIVGQPEHQSIRCARMRAAVLRQWDVMHSMMGAVIVTRDVTGTGVPMPEVEGQMDCRIVGVMPPATDGLRAATEVGTPLVLHQPDQISAVTLTEMAHRLAADPIRTMQF